MPLVDYIIGHDQMGLSVHRSLGIVTDKTAPSGVGHHGTGVQFSQGDLAVRGFIQRLAHVLKALVFLPDAAGTLRKVGDLLSPQLFPLGGRSEPSR